MHVDDCFQLGKIIRAHGTKGELLVALLVLHPEEYITKESVFVEINNKLIPFFVEKFTVLNSNKAILQLDDIGSEDQANDILDCLLYLPLTELPSKKDGHFYYHQIINYKIVDTNLGILGTVKEVYEMPGQDMLEMDYKNSEVLIPINEALVHHAEHSKQILHVTLPDGLLDIYLSTQTEQPDDAD